MPSRFSKFPRRRGNYLRPVHPIDQIGNMQSIGTIERDAAIRRMALKPGIKRKDIYRAFPFITPRRIQKILAEANLERPKGKRNPPVPKKPAFFSRDMAPRFMDDFYSGKFTDVQLMEKYGVSPTKFRELTGESPKRK